MTVAIDLINAEIAAARVKHGESFEQAGDDVKLRIMVEEVGEVARAIQDLANAEAHRVMVSRHGSTAELEAARDAVVDAHSHLLDEVSQVGACAVRWLDSAGAP